MAESIPLLSCPLSSESIRQVRAGKRVQVAGTLYLAGKAARARLAEAVESQVTAPPFALQGQVVVCVDSRDGWRIAAWNSGGDRALARLFAHGLAGVVARGNPSGALRYALRKYGGVYFRPSDGAERALASCLLFARPVGYPDLGSGALFQVKVERLPLRAVVDSSGDEVEDDPVGECVGT